MAILKDIMAYFCKEYGDKNDLSKARMTKMVYLADWKSAIKYQRQISSIKWIYNHYGPYVDDVERVALTDESFKIESTINVCGNHKSIIKLNETGYEPSLRENEKAVLDHIIEITIGKNWEQFMEIVYSTYPIRKSEQYKILDLVELAKEYDNEE